METSSLLEKASWKPKASLALGICVCLFNWFLPIMYLIFSSYTQENRNFVGKVFEFLGIKGLPTIIPMLLVGLVATVFNLVINIRGRKFLKKTDQENKHGIALYSWGIAFSSLGCVASLFILTIVGFFSLLVLLMCPGGICS